MTSGFSLIILVTISVLHSVFADGDTHHHRVIIHVPYKIHTIHHIKHIHHQKKDDGDKYEVIGYTIGKPIDLSLQLGDHHHYEPHLPPPPPPPPVPLHHHHEPPPHHHHHQEEPHHHEFSGGNELGYGHEWSPSFGHESHGGGHGEAALYDHAHFGGGHEFTGQHENFGGYD